MKIYHAIHRVIDGQYVDELQVIVRASSIKDARKQLKLHNILIPPQEWLLTKFKESGAIFDLGRHTYLI